MKTCRSLLLLTLLGLLGSVPLCAAQEGKPSTPWYEVEILIFARQADGTGSTEHWVEDLESPDWSGSVRPDRYGLVPGSKRLLGPAAYSLKRSRARLKPMIHAAWRQPVRGPSRAQEVYLQSKKGTSSGNPVVEGVIKTSVNRYLHVDLDFLLRRPAPTGDGTGYQPGAEQTYRFKAHRRMRSGELHFIDHPLVGALIQINPYQKPLPETKTDTPAASTSSTSPQQTDASPAASPAEKP